MIDLDMPTIAMGGGFLLLFMLACVLMLGRRRRIDPHAGRSRRTSFHLVAIDPEIAEHRRAAWECAPPVAEVHEVEEDMVEAVEIAMPPVTDHTSIGHAPVPPPRYARGSTPAITTAPRAHVSLPARPIGWGVPVAPSVTARMRATRRA